jgi:hypothetical protein
MSWPLFNSLPRGFIFDEATGSPKTGYCFATNRVSIINGGKRILVRISSEQNKLITEASKQESDAVRKIAITSATLKNSDWKIFDGNCAKTVNDLARSQFKLRLLNDILADLTICEVEGWSKTAYINELKSLINNIMPSKCKSKLEVTP